ncbi:MAG: peroxiredoxin family protein [Anaerolineales bacterium]|jgi:peroxiredoxin
MANKSWWLYSLLILILGAVWIVISAPDRDELQSWQAAAPVVGMQAPDFQLVSNSGEDLQLSNYQDKAIILNFWASWCPPCRSEMPAMQQIYEKYQEQGLIVIAVNATSSDSIDKANEFVQTNSLNFPIVYDLDGAVNHAYQVGSLPTTFFITPTGTIDDIVIGGPMSAALLSTRAEKILGDNSN